MFKHNTGTGQTDNMHRYVCSGKWCHAPGAGVYCICSSPCLSDAWPVRRQTYGYLPSLRRYQIYTAWWQLAAQDINPIAYAPEFTWPNSSNKLLAIRPAVISEQFSPTFQREKTIRHTCKPVILHLAGIKSLLQHCGRTTAFFKSGGNMPEAKELLNRRVMNGVSDNSVLISLTSHIGAGSNRQVLHNAEPIRFSALSIDTGVHFSNVNTNLCGTSYIREAEVDERTDSYTSNVTTATQHCCKTW